MTKDPLEDKVAALCHLHWTARLSAMFASASQVKADCGITTHYLIHSELREELQRHIVSTITGLGEKDKEWKDHCYKEALELIALVKEEMGERKAGI